jgi:hypothetical protein
MSTATICLIQYAFVAFATLLAGPLLGRVSAAQSFPFALFGLDGGHTIRLVLESTGLLLLCLLAFHANGQMPEDGKGWSFVKRLILPLTALLALLVADNALGATGLPLAGPLYPRLRRRFADMRPLDICRLAGELRCAERFFRISGTAGARCRAFAGRPLSDVGQHSG